MEKITGKFIKQIRRELQELPPDIRSEQIEATARRLEAQNYSPMLLVEVPGFLRMRRQELIDTVEELIKTRREELTPQHLSLLLYHYRRLQQLRRDDPEAWDVVNELMDDD
jgi:hypothetical protein